MIAGGHGRQRPGDDRGQWLATSCRTLRATLQRSPANGSGSTLATRHAFAGGHCGQRRTVRRRTVPGSGDDRGQWPRRVPANCATSCRTRYAPRCSVRRRPLRPASRGQPLRPRPRAVPANRRRTAPRVRRRPASNGSPVPATNCGQWLATSCRTLRATLQRSPAICAGSVLATRYAVPRGHCGHGRQRPGDDRGQWPRRVPAMIAASHCASVSRPATAPGRCSVSPAAVAASGSGDHRRRP